METSNYIVKHFFMLEQNEERHYLIKIPNAKIHEKNQA